MAGHLGLALLFHLASVMYSRIGVALIQFLVLSGSNPCTFVCGVGVLVDNKAYYLKGSLVDERLR